MNSRFFKLLLVRDKRLSFFKQIHSSLIRSHSVHKPPQVYQPGKSFKARIRDPKYDPNFKILMGEKGAENRIMSFINAVLNLPDNERIMELQYLNPSDEQPDDRNIHFDTTIECTCFTNKGNRFIVEIEKAHVPGHDNRWVYYAGRELIRLGKIQNQLISREKDKTLRKKKRAEFYKNLNSVKLICILNFDTDISSVLKNKEDVVIHWNITESKNEEIASNLLSWTFVILPRFLAKNGGGKLNRLYNICF
jgi:hypothetical protein